MVKHDHYGFVQQWLSCSKRNWDDIATLDELTEDKVQVLFVMSYDDVERFGFAIWGYRAINAWYLKLFILYIM